MFDKVLKYELGYFTNNDKLLDSKSIMAIVNSVEEIQLLPNFVPLFTSEGPKKMLELSSENNEWKIPFLPDRIAILKDAIDNNWNLGALEEFTQQATKILEAILNVYPRSGNRLALFEQSFLHIKDDLNVRFYNHIFRKSDFYNEHIPFEWGWRTAACEEFEIDNCKENVNCVSELAIKELDNRLQQNPILERRIDINTSHKNSAYRFDVKDIQEFVSQALSTNKIMANSLIKLLNGDKHE